MRHLLWASLAALPLCAQTVISARSGLINYVEGPVLVDGKAVSAATYSRFSEVKANQILRTEEGRDSGSSYSTASSTSAGSSGTVAASGASTSASQASSSAVSAGSSSAGGHHR